MTTDAATTAATTDTTTQNAPPEFEAPWSKTEGVYMIGEGEAAKPWWEGIKDEPIRNYVKEKNYANPYEAASAAWNANKINKLTPDIQAVIEGKATPEQEANFYKTLGRPETPDGYELKPAQGVEVDQDLLKFGKELFHGLGLPPGKAQQAFDKWNEYAARTQSAHVEASRVQNETEIADLAKRWGPELEANRAAGNRAVQALGLSNEIIQKIESSIGSAAIVELLAVIGKKSAEGNFVDTGSAADPNDPNTLNKEQAKAKITQLMADPEFNKKYTDKNNPGHKDAVTLMERLHAKAG